MIHMFVLEWLKLVEYCNHPDFDTGIFTAYHDNYKNHWAKLSASDQGEISYRLSKLMEK